LTVLSKVGSPADNYRKNAVTLAVRVGAFRVLSAVVLGEVIGERRALVRARRELSLQPDAHSAAGAKEGG